MRIKLGAQDKNNPGTNTGSDTPIFPKGGSLREWDYEKETC